MPPDGLAASFAEGRTWGPGVSGSRLRSSRRVGPDAAGCIRSLVALVGCHGSAPCRSGDLCIVDLNAGER
jgi:hypothetical protein